MQRALTAPTLADRLAAGAAAGRQIMERTGPLFAVAQQAAAVEPLIAGFWLEGRMQSRYAQEVFWTRLAEDGLLPASTDLAWLTDTASVISAAETYLLVTRMLGWDLDAYQAWLALTLTRLVTSGGQVLRSGIDLKDIQSPHRPACVSAETLRERLHQPLPRKRLVNRVERYARAESAGNQSRGPADPARLRNRATLIQWL